MRRDFLIPIVRTPENVLPFFASCSAGLVKAAGWYVELVAHYSHQCWHKHAFTTQQALFVFCFFFNKSEAHVSVVCLCGQTTLLCPARLCRSLFFLLCLGSSQKSSKLCSVTGRCCGETAVTFLALKFYFQTKFWNKIIPFAQKWCILVDLLPWFLPVRGVGGGMPKSKREILMRFSFAN